MRRKDKLTVSSLGNFLAAVEQCQRAERFVDDGANYQNANHNVTKMEAIYAVVI